MCGAIFSIFIFLGKSVIYVLNWIYQFETRSLEEAFLFTDFYSCWLLTICSITIQPIFFSLLQIKCWFLGPRGPLRLPLMPVVVPFPQQYFSLFKLYAHATSPTAHSTQNRVISRTFLLQFGLVYKSFHNYIRKS